MFPARFSGFMWLFQSIVVWVWCNVCFGAWFFFIARGGGLGEGVFVKKDSWGERERDRKREVESEREREDFREGK